MADPPDKGGGGSPLLKNVDSNPDPDQTTLDPTKAGQSVTGGHSQPPPTQRPFDQIIAEASADRNILQIHLKKINLEEETITKSLTYEDLGEFIFDVLKINPEDCLGLDLSTGRYDTREIQLKPNVNVSAYLSTVQFKGHEITVQRTLKNVTRVTFKNVPLSVPDEEIIHLCKAYGNPVDYLVHRENLRLMAPTKRIITGSTRYVDVFLNSQTSFRNYYWLEGPLQGDTGRRITVLHNNQPQQCSHCLRISATGCPAGGNGKICNSMNTPRGKMSVYMESLKLQDNYESLKSKYLEQQTKAFPLLGNQKNLRECTQSQSEIIDKADQEAVPIEEKDAKIENLERENLALIAQIEELDSTRENLAKIKAENFQIKKTSLQLSKKLNLTRKTSELKLAEMITSESNEDTPYLITSYSASLNEEDFELDADNDVIIPKSDAFLKNIKDRCNLDDSEQNERYSEVKNQVLDRVKKLFTSSPSSSRRLSISSTGSKREWKNSDEEEELSEHSSSKLRTESPVKID